MSKIIKFFIVFLMVAAAVFLLDRQFFVNFGNENFWNHRGVFFLIFISFFPRLTLLFSSVAGGGIFWWLAWLFVPRVLVAMLATLAYWNQNKILVVIAWLVAISGESSEKMVIVRKSPRVGRISRRPKGDIIDVTPEPKS